MPEAGSGAGQGATLMYVDALGKAQFMGINGMPQAAVPVNASSGNVANSAAVATMPADAVKTNYISGFEITAAGATVGIVVVVTVAGIIGGTLSFVFVVPAGALLGAAPLQVVFSMPIPAAAINTAIVVTCPALGIGNTNAAANVHGFKV